MSKYISKKAFIVILVLSVVVTYGVAMFGFAIENVYISDGFPLGFSSFNFLGSSTDYKNLIIDVIFWFTVIWGIWKTLQKLTSKR